MKKANIDLLSGSTQSIATTQNLSAIPMGDMKHASIQLVYTGTPAGNFKLQISNDKPGATPSNWTDVANTATTISAAGNMTFEYPDCTVEWLRVVWTATGAGTTPVLTVARAVTKG